MLKRVLGIIMVLLSLFLLVPSGKAYAKTEEEYQKEISDLRNTVSELNSEKNGLEEELSTLSKENKELSEKVSSLEAQIQILKTENQNDLEADPESYYENYLNALASYEELKEASGKQIKELEARIADLEKEVAELNIKLLSKESAPVSSPKPTEAPKAEEPEAVSEDIEEKVSAVEPESEPSPTVSVVENEAVVHVSLSVPDNFNKELICAFASKEGKEYRTIFDADTDYEKVIYLPSGVYSFTGVVNCPDDIKVSINKKLTILRTDACYEWNGTVSYNAPAEENVKAGETTVSKDAQIAEYQSPGFGRYIIFTVIIALLVAAVVWLSVKLYYGKKTTNIIKEKRRESNEKA